MRGTKQSLKLDRTSSVIARVRSNLLNSIEPLLSLRGTKQSLKLDR
ncbi:hypothetical protein ACN4EE_05920 [Geminocystis sp. CENA526]